MKGHYFQVFAISAAVALIILAMIFMEILLS